MDAQTLWLHTVDTHVRHVYDKLYVRSRTGAVTKALQERLLRGPSRPGLPVGPRLPMKLYHQDIGQGEVVLLLHGFTGSSRDWLPLLPLLPASFRYIIPDLRGHGRSPNPEQTYTHRQAAIDVWKLVDDLKIDRFKACGMSGGAMALLHMATQESTRIESMILVSPTTHYPEQARKIMGAVNPEDMPSEEWDSMREKHPRGDEQIRELWRLSKAFKDDYEDMNFQTSDLRRVEARTFIVHGDADPLFPLEIAQELNHELRDSSLWIVEGGGHVPVFGDVMSEFFSRVSRFLLANREG